MRVYRFSETLNIFVIAVLGLFFCQLFYYIKIRVIKPRESNLQSFEYFRIFFTTDFQRRTLLFAKIARVPDPLGRRRDASRNSRDTSREVPPRPVNFPVVNEKRTSESYPYPLSGARGDREFDGK